MKKEKYGIWMSTIKLPEIQYTEKVKDIRDRLQKEHPTAKITYWRGQWKIKYPLPKDYFRITGITRIKDKIR